jgi:CSLREA domain-containing protein
MSRFSSALTLLTLVIIVGALLPVGPVASTPVALASGVFVVTSTADTGGSCASTPTNCTLRQAINAANASGGTIQFAIPTTDPNYRPGSGDPFFIGRSWVIRPGSIPLPPLNNNITINGSTQASEGNNPVGPEIVIDGSLFTGRNGLTLNGSGNIISDVAIINFDSGSLAGSGIAIAGSNNRVTNTFIGVDADGITVGGNGFAGIWIQTNANNNLISNNLISGNDLDGIVVQGNNNTLSGNFIGTNLSGTNNIPNNGSGVLIQGSGNIIGPPDGGGILDRNFISGNLGYGVLIDGGSNNRIAGNRIGIGIDGFGLPTLSWPNNAGGVEIRDFLGNATENRIGLSDPSGSSPYRNFIAGNTGPGIRLRGERTTNTSIVNNWIGLNNDGSPLTATNNTGGGIVIEAGVTGVTIGGTSPGDRNVISGNAGDGIVIRGLSASQATSNNTIIGNYIGTRVNGSLTGSGFANRSGIVIDNHVFNTVIGTPDAPNRIGFNLNYGVAITGTGVLTTTLNDNAIVSNGFDGVYAVGAVNLRITGVNTPTLIAGNRRNGVWIDSGQAIAIENALLLNNADDGARLANVADVTLRSVTAQLNDENGIRYEGGITTTLTNLTVQQNGQNGLWFTGVLTNTQIVATRAISNALNGFLINGTTDVMTISGNEIVGNGASGMALTLTPGVAPVRDVIVSGNTLDRNAFNSSAFGVQISGGTEVVTVTGNVVDGTRNGGGFLLPGANRMTISGNAVRYNNGPGFQVSGGSDSVIIEGNEVISNTLGIEVRDAATIDVVVRGNSIYQSGATGWGGFGSGVGVAVNNAQRTRVEGNSITANLGAGVHVQGAATQTRVLGNFIVNNALGVLVGAPVGGPFTPPYPQQTQILNNSISGNGIPPGGPFPVDETLLGRGIVLNPETPTGGVAGNPNNDIDPPLQSSLRMNAAGVLTGQVDTTGAPGGCPSSGGVRCLIQVFRPDQTMLDGQGQEFAGETVVDATGAFTVTVGSIPRQLTLTATDPVSNTSRFAIFAPRPSLSISAPQAITADPGQVITYTHTVVNDGNIELSDVRIAVTTSRGWEGLSPPIAIQPSGSFSLAPGASRAITVSVRVPTGGGPQAAPGVDLMTVRVDGTTVSGGNTYTATASLVNTTTVNARIYLELTPALVEGRGNPGVAVPYAFQVRNTGNISATTSITATFDDLVFSVNWQRSLSTTSLTIPPGETRSFQLTVTVPPESANPVSGTYADVTVAITPTLPIDPSQARTAKARTIVGQVSRAQITPASDEKEGKPGETVVFLHEITNLGNGADTFQINGTPALGSVVRFTSLTSGVTINSEGRFTLAQGATAIIRVEVTVNPQLANGNVENVFIDLRDLNGNVIGGAFAQDRVRVVSSIRRVYLPLVIR